MQTPRVLNDDAACIKCSHAFNAGTRAFVQTLYCMQHSTPSREHSTPSREHCEYASSCDNGQATLQTSSCDNGGSNPPNIFVRQWWQQPSKHLRATMVAATLQTSSCDNGPAALQTSSCDNGGSNPPNIFVRQWWPQPSKHGFELCPLDLANVARFEVSIEKLFNVHDSLTASSTGVACCEPRSLMS